MSACFLFPFPGYTRSNWDSGLIARPVSAMATLKLLVIDTDYAPFRLAMKKI